jgi:hypothetical protein
MNKKEILLKSKIRLGPMSKNIVDSIIKFSNKHKVYITLIPSRRQVDYNSGYVNNWTTKTFAEYVKSQSQYIAIQCDHAGPAQGAKDDDGLESLAECCKNYDSIHIDPFKKYHELRDAITHTIRLIKYCFELNPHIYFEIGTEFGIRPLKTKDIDNLIYACKQELKPEIFKHILFCVIQSGTLTKECTNQGQYNMYNQLAMTNVVKTYGLHTVEHNFDYLLFKEMKFRFLQGLDCANIAPGIATIESKAIYDLLNINQKDKFFEIVLNSKKWVKWFPADFEPEKHKELLIQSCGHYVFSYPEFIELTKDMNNKIIIDDIMQYLINIESLMIKNTL